MKQFLAWLHRKWSPESEVAPEDFEQTFVASPSGQRVLHHLLDTVYCQVYTGKDPYECMALNGRRSVIHEILIEIDKAQHPDKYQTQVESKPWDVRRTDGRVGA